MSQPLAFRPTSREDLPRLASFLDRWLGRSPAAAGFRPDDFDWKYWTPRQDGSDPRSYVLVNDRGIVAHCGLVPSWRHGPDGSRITCAHFIDWAADPASLGSGVRVLRKVLELTDLTVAVGGTKATRTILPLARFRAANETMFLARPVRPWRQLWTHQLRNWKLPIRLARNVLWSSVPSLQSPRGWRVEPIEPDRAPAELWTSAASTPLGRERTPTTYAHYLGCPFMRFRLFLLSRTDPIGGVLIGFHLGQARIVDLWVIDESGRIPAAAYQLAILAALSDRSVAEVIVAVSIDARLEAVMRCGFREYRRERIMTYSAGQLSGTPYDYQWLDDDVAFLTGETTEYMT